MHQVVIGNKYGHLTVLREVNRGKHGERRFWCRCECGNEKDFDVYNILRNPDHRCNKCVPHQGGYPPPDLTGQIINGWEVLERVSAEPNKYGTGIDYYFRCRCQRCGNESIKRPNAIKTSKGHRCSKCLPVYNFVVKGDVAEGTLTNGTPFLIDACDIPKIQRKRWRLAKDGYIKSDDGFYLHRFIMGITDRKDIIDHINRNRHDNRKSNLRVISNFGNSCNHSIFQTNKTGYTGVYYSKCAGRYEVKIGYNNKRIKLGSSKNDLVTLAQMYNIGASFLFGEYAGQLNDVPEPPEDLVKYVTEKCKQYKKTPAQENSPAA